MVVRSASSSKAIRSLTKVAAREWGKYGITVHTISPAAMTPFNEAHFGTPEQLNASFDELRAAIRELADPAEVGRAVVYLCSPDARHITGCLLNVDSGCGML